MYDAQITPKKIVRLMIKGLAKGKAFIKQAESEVEVAKGKRLVKRVASEGKRFVE